MAELEEINRRRVKSNDSWKAIKYLPLVTTLFFVTTFLYVYLKHKIFFISPLLIYFLISVGCIYFLFSLNEQLRILLPKILSLVGKDEKKKLVSSYRKLFSLHTGFLIPVAFTLLGTGIELNSLKQIVDPYNLTYIILVNDLVATLLSLAAFYIYLNVTIGFQRLRSRYYLPTMNFFSLRSVLSEFGETYTRATFNAFIIFMLWILLRGSSLIPSQWQSVADTLFQSDYYEYSWTRTLLFWHLFFGFILIANFLYQSHSMSLWIHTAKNSLIFKLSTHLDEASKVAAEFPKNTACREEFSNIKAFIKEIELVKTAPYNLKLIATSFLSTTIPVILMIIELIKKLSNAK
jgi:hypothetical protein